MTTENQILPDIMYNDRIIKFYQKVPLITSLYLFIEGNGLERRAVI